MSTTRTGAAGDEAQAIANVIAEYGRDNISDVRLMFQDLLGLPIPRDASQALTAAMFHLDGLEAACNAIHRILG
jgi:hypothetical protein